MLAVTCPFNYSGGTCLAFVDEEKGVIRAQYPSPVGLRGMVYREDIGLLIGTEKGTIIQFPLKKSKRLSHKWKVFHESKEEHDIHDMVLDGPFLYKASTYGDAVRCLDIWGKKDMHYWRCQPIKAYDSRHVSSICWLKGPIVSMFQLEPREEEAPWRLEKPGRGVIFNVATGKSIVKGLTYPHSLLTFDGQLCYVESKVNKVHMGNITYELPPLHTFARGLCRTELGLWVGHSDMRRWKSEGMTSDALTSAYIENILSDDRTRISVPMPEIFCILSLPGMSI